MGLSIADAIGLLMLRIADERRLPFEVQVPNTITRKAISELETGKGKRFASVGDLMADLHTCWRPTNHPMADTTTKNNQRIRRPQGTQTDARGM